MFIQTSSVGSEPLSISYCPPLGELITILGYEDPHWKLVMASFKRKAIDENLFMVSFKRETIDVNQVVVSFRREAIDVNQVMVLDKRKAIDVNLFMV